MLKRLFFSSLVLLGCFVLAFAAWLYWHLNQPLQLEKLANTSANLDAKNNYEIELQPGQSFLSLLHSFNQQKVIATSLPMRIWLKLFASNQPIHQGEYLLTPPLNQLDLLKLLQAGKVKTYEFRLIEGTSFQQLKQQLANTPKLKHLTQQLSQTELMQQLGATETAIQIAELQPAEGWFFPATYTYSKNTSDLSLLAQAYKKMQQHLAEIWPEAQKNNLPYKSPYQLLTMASLIEKETGVPYERPDIAGVFIRRLEKRMRLQTDPTVIYGMQDNYKGRITYKDLRTPTPWNTYTNNGLPPTPIAMPGLAALKAAANPAAGTALYFVAKGDGSHQFSNTLEEHNQAVKRYQLNRKADYRSSPAPVN